MTCKNGVETQPPPNILSKEEIKDYMQVFPEILDKLIKLSLNTYPESSDMGHMTDWMSKVLQYHLSSEPRHLGGTLVPAARKSLKSGKLDTESLKLAYIMGWGLEICHSAKQIADNIMDTRSFIDGDTSKPAWHTKEHVGMTAVNDNFVMKVANYNILKIFFADKPYYYQLQDSARDGYQKAVLGRALWEQMEKENCLATSYTMERYKTVISYMSSYYSFYMPVESTLIMTGLSGDESELKASLKRLMLQIGYYHQLVTDFANIFGKKKFWLDNANGKIRRLTWFFVKALQTTKENQLNDLVHLTNGTQRTNENTGDKLRKFYIDMQLIEKFEYEKVLVCAAIKEQIGALPSPGIISVNFFDKILADIDSLL